MKYLKINLIIFILISHSIVLTAQNRVKEGVYELTVFKEKEYMQIFYNADTLKFIKIDNKSDQTFSFYPNSKKKLLFEHNSNALGRARMKFKFNKDQFADELKLSVKMGIWIGFKAKWISGFDKVDTNLTNCSNRAAFFERNYNKFGYYIAMRDGVRLFTQVYTPKECEKNSPAILVRTPYGIHPYGSTFTSNILPSFYFAKEKYILVYQDIRGRFMSEGKFRKISPLLDKNENGTDEATDTYDTIEWLIENLKNHNGNIGIHGVSYSGYLASVAATCGHLAIKAISTQAPMADGFLGDDFRRNGALYLNHSAYYLYAMGQDIDNPVKGFAKKMKPPIKDAYSLFLKFKSLNNITDSLFDYNCNWWNEILSHENNDEYWQSRSIFSYANQIKVPILHVGGWYDAENLSGPLLTYQLTEKQDISNGNYLVVGPWIHGGWSSNTGSERVGAFSFNGTSSFFENNIEKEFFNYYLKDQSKLKLPEATIYNTGTRNWTEFESWPPKNIELTELFFEENYLLQFNKNTCTNLTAFDEFISNPDNPVPYTEKAQIRYNKNYFTEDQRFVSHRDDILTYTSEILTEDVIVAGKVTADLFVSTSGTDSDWIVKIIDVLSEDTLVGYELLVRADIMRGKYRSNDTIPEPFISNQITNVKWKLPDLMHTFKKGHRIKIQIQCSWFPLYDLNPQQFCRISEAKEKDFIKTNQKIYRGSDYSSKIILPVLKNL